MHCFAAKELEGSVDMESCFQYIYVIIYDVLFLCCFLIDLFVLYLQELRSYFWKKIMLVWISLSTAGLLYYFVQHRFYCIPGGMHMFSTWEVLICLMQLLLYCINGSLDSEKCYMLCTVIMWFAYIIIN